ncbi:arylsulfatase [Bacteroidota bacterium]
MKKTGFFLLFTALMILSAGAQDRPNIVFILADDFGYGSLNSYGADKDLLRTPHIDRIASQGMSFKDASTPASICSPTRYGFLMGRYPWRSSLKFGVVSPTGPLLPDPDRTSIADWLKERGYSTAAIGKWHLGYGSVDPCDYTGILSPGPLELGFDYHFGVPQNHDDKTGVYVENDKIYGLKSKKVQPYSRSYYGTRYMGFDAPQRVNKDVMGDLTDKAVDWMKTRDTEQPFFLYFASIAVHHPITPSDGMRGVSNCGPYGDFIQDLDQAVGRILETLDYLGVADNTILIFSSDNGGDIPKNHPEAPETQAEEAGLKINGALRGDKHTIWEGGTRVPFIVKWPGKIKEGSESAGMINLIDIFATLAEILDGEQPDPSVAAPDSYSFLSSLIQSGAKAGRNAMVTADVDGMQAIRIGEWKYIDDVYPEGLAENRLKQLRNFKPQLYNIDLDPSEQNNLYESNPKVVRKLKAELDLIRNTEPGRK